MNSIIETVNSVVGGLTSILLGLLGLGIVANILFGANMFIGDVIGNISLIVSSLGNRMAGLIRQSSLFTYWVLVTKPRSNIPVIVNAYLNGTH